MTNLIFYALFLLHNISFSQTQLLLDLKEEVKVTAESPSSAQEKAQQQVLEKFVNQFSRDLIGEKKTEQNANLLKQFVSKESGKWAPVVKSVPRLESGEYTVSVEIKVSSANLRQIFESSGLLSSDLESGVVLPFISLVDQVRTKTHKWWTSEVAPDEILKDTHTALVSELQKSFRKFNFFVIDPMNWQFSKSLPSRLQKDYYSRSDYSYLETYFKFPLSLRGQIDILPSGKASNIYKIQMKIEVVSNTLGKPIAETLRTVETEPSDLKSAISKSSLYKEIAEDLADQMNSALRKGLLDSSLIQLRLTGNLSFKNTENFKNTLSKSLGALRYISERWIENNQRVYELDYSGTPQDLAKRIESLPFNGFKVKSIDADTQKIDVRIE